MSVSRPVEGGGLWHALPCCLGLMVAPLSAASQIAILGTFFTVVFALYLAPLTISSPCIMEKKDLGPKPALIGHRGAPMVSATCGP